MPAALLLVLTKVYGVDSSWAPAFLIPFAIGNLVGPLTIGRLFDTIGRRRMIAGTYILARGRGEPAVGGQAGRLSGRQSLR